MRPVKIRLVRGDSLRLQLDYYSSSLRGVKITSATAGLPAVLRAPAHGLSAGDTVVVYDVPGIMDDATYPPLNSSFANVTVVDADSVTLDNVKYDADTPYKGGGMLVTRVRVDLTGCVVACQVRRDGGVVATASVSVGRQIVLSLPPDSGVQSGDTADVQVTFADGSVQTIAAYEFEVDEDVTR